MRSRNKSKKYDFDLIIIGSGPAGSIAAHLAATEGKNVALIESSTTGGNSLRYGYVPTHALLKTANVLNIIKSSTQFGIRPNFASFNYKSVQYWKNKAIDATGIKNEARAFKSDGVFLIKGHAHFLDALTVNVGLKHYRAPKFLIASGAEPYVPDIAGLADAGFITYQEAVNLTKLPKSIVIIGGGRIAYEFSQIFRAFELKVTVLENNSHLLPNEDPEISDSAEAALNRCGVKIITSARVNKVSKKAGKKILNIEKDGKIYRLMTDEILLACGKTPKVDIGIQNTSVKYSNQGVFVNRRMQTNKKHIYAAGEVVNSSTPPHLSIEESRIAAHNMFHKNKISINTHVVPRCYCGQPEIAIVGKTERELLKSGESFQTSIAPIGILGKALTNNYTSGFVKIIASHSGVIVGASIVAPEASEMISELTFAISNRHHACAIAKTIHPFPSYSEAVRVAASKINCA
jgi:pyruvate/2-oxoglutarate dehydrogenase complex dihydrolipoamide dehydrogenase (E3) component